jgi:G3E family GTPase
MSLAQKPDKKCSVLLLSGFLGAGKTTLLRRILSWESDLSDTVVLVNEFGKIGIDGDLIKDSGSDVIELTSGCICCTLNADLKKSLLQIWEKYHPGCILIEASGVADPTAILNIFEEPDLTRSMALEKVVTVLDADYWEARENFGPLFYNQLAAAHLILLNKADQVEGDKIPAFLEQIHDLVPDCQVIPTVHCDIDPGTLWSPSSLSKVNFKLFHNFRPAFLEKSHETRGGDDQGQLTPIHSSNFVTFSFESAQNMDPDRFRQLIETLPWEVFRIKGNVRFPRRTRFLNYVGGKADWSERDDELATKLTFIGWNVNAKDILDRVDGCIVLPP